MTATPVSVTVAAPPDSTPPSIPGTPTAQVGSSSEISLTWTASTDNVGITGYSIFRNGAFIATTTTTNYQDATLAPLTTYTYTITARDAAGNESLPSTSVSATTLASPDTTPPSVTLTAPSQGSTVAGMVTLTATATDNVGVVGVQFSLNGSNLGEEDPTNHVFSFLGYYRGGPGAILVNRNCSRCCREFHDGHTGFRYGGRATGLHSPEHPGNPYRSGGF